MGVDVDSFADFFATEPRCVPPVVDVYFDGPSPAHAAAITQRAPPDTRRGRGPHRAMTLIADIHRNALDDGPGIRTVVFFKDCNLRCRDVMRAAGLEVV